MEPIKANAVKIRYNTESDGKELNWRLNIDGVEHLVNHMTIECPCKTTTDWLADKQVYKHHITVNECLVFIHPETLNVTIKQH